MMGGKDKRFGVVSFVFLVLTIIVVLYFTFSSRKASTKGLEDEVVNNGPAIVLGNTCAQSGFAGLIGSELMKGAMAYIAKVNKNGGVAGRAIEVISLDDMYDPVKCISNTLTLLREYPVLCLFNFVGTPTSVNVLDLLKESQVPSIGFFTGAEELRAPVAPNIFHLRVSYGDECEALAHYLADAKGLKRFVVLYQEDEFGLEVLSGLQFALYKRNLEPLVTKTFRRGSNDFGDALDVFMKYEPDVVFFVGTYTPFLDMIEGLLQKGYKGIFATVSFVNSYAFANKAVERRLGLSALSDRIIISQVVPTPICRDEADCPALIREYLADMAEYGPFMPNQISFEGYLNAKVIVATYTITII